MASLFIEDRLHKALLKQKVNIKNLIGDIETPEQEKELIIGFIRTLNFNIEFKDWYEKLTEKTEKFLAKQKNKKYYCKELGYTVKLTEDDGLEVIPD
jgi:hypothetical protein